MQNAKQVFLLYQILYKLEEYDVTCGSAFHINGDSVFHYLLTACHKALLFSLVELCFVDCVGVKASYSDML